MSSNKRQMSTVPLVWYLTAAILDGYFRCWKLHKEESNYSENGIKISMFLNFCLPSLLSVPSGYQ